MRATPDAHRQGLDGVPRLESGDHLSRREFVRRYEAMQDTRKAELVGGVAFVHEPTRLWEHGLPESLVACWLTTFSSRTPGTLACVETTLRLGDDNEFQPDAALFLDRRCGGRCSTDEQGCLTGPPELVVEIAASSVSFDLHTKRDVYERFGVSEYLVVRTLDQAVDWFRLEEKRYRNHGGQAEGVWKSQEFPGLWLKVSALLQNDAAGLLQTLGDGLADDAHRQFARELERRRNQAG